jgi:hypothetical protein
MQKSRKSLSLGRESLKNLSPAAMREAGGAGLQPVPIGGWVPQSPGMLCQLSYACDEDELKPLKK